MEPRVSKREKKVILTYDLPSRIRCAAIHPALAPNGSTLVLYGHDRGLRALWRGGRKVVQHESAHDDHMSLDDEDPAQHHEESEEYEDEEEELDSDCPYPSVLYTLDVELDSAVSRIAIPSRSSTSRSTAKKDATVVVATLEGGIYVLRIPLIPPHESRANKIAQSIRRESIHLRKPSGYVRALAAKLIHESEVKLLVAAASDQLELWQLPAEAIKKNAHPQHTSISTTKMVAGVSFHPSPRSRDLIVADKFGTLSVCAAAFPPQEQSVNWLYTLYTPFEPQPESSPARPSRKRLLDARFILDGRCILAVLDDGQWGIWDTTASQSGKSLDQFVLSGYLESAVPVDTAQPVVAKAAVSALTPMTPNTRKVKANGLFSSPQARPDGRAATGGISVARTTSTAGATDESVMIWHNNEVYAIPSMQSFWQRSTSGSSSLGTLYAPGIARIQGPKLFSESVTSVSQFAAASAASGIGQLKMQRDFLVSAEHRFVIVQSRATLSSKTQPVDVSDMPDQRMLDTGELDLGGMDRILNSMEERPRKVGFAY